MARDVAAYHVVIQRVFVHEAGKRRLDARAFLVDCVVYRVGKAAYGVVDFRRVNRRSHHSVQPPQLFAVVGQVLELYAFNIYTSADCPLFVDELQEIDAFMDELSPQIDVIWGVSEDNTLDNDAKIAILATGLDDDCNDFNRADNGYGDNDMEHYRVLIKKLYQPADAKADTTRQDPDDIPITVSGGTDGTPVTDDTPSGSGEDVTEPTDDIPTDDTDTPHDDVPVTEEHVTRPQPSTVMPLVDRLKKIWNDILKE